MENRCVIFILMFLRKSSEWVRVGQGNKCGGVWGEGGGEGGEGGEMKWRRGRDKG